MISELIVCFVVGAIADPPKSQLTWPDVDDAPKFVPAKPISEAEKKRIEADKDFVVAVMYERQDRLADALTWFRKALKTDPSHLAALRLAALTAAQLDKKDEALDYCNRVIARDPYDADRLYIAGLIHASKGDLDKSIESMEKARTIPNLADTKPLRYVAVREILVDLYGRRPNPKQLAKVIEELVDVINKPDRYDLDPVNLRILSQQKLTLQLKQADALRQSKQFAMAETLLQNLISDKPNMKRRLLLEIAQIRFDANKPDDSLKTLNEYFEQGDSRQQASFDLLDKIYSSTNRSDQLLEALDKVHTRQPNNDIAARYYARKLVDAKNYRKAEQVLRISGADKDKESLPVMAVIYINLNDEENLLKVLSKFIDNPSIEADLEGVLSELQRNREVLRKLAAAAPNVGKDEANRQQILYLIGIVAARMGDYSIVADMFGRLVTSNPKAKEFRQQLVLALLQLEKWDACIAAADDALKVFPEDLTISEFKASALARMGKSAEAIEMLEKLTKTAEGLDRLVDVRLAIALTYQQADQYDKACEVYRKLIQEFPKPPDVHRYRYYLAGALSLGGKNSEAEKELIQIIEANPPADRRYLAGANNDLGYMWADEGRNLDRAEAMIRMAVSYENDNSAYQDSLGWVLFKRGRFKESEEWLSKAAAAKGSEDPVIWDHLGDCRLQLGNKQAAGEAWIKAVRLYEKGSQRTKPEKAEAVRRKAAAILGADWESDYPK